MSLRARLLITAVVLVAVGLVAANVATYRSLSSFLLQRVDEQLAQAVFPMASALSAQAGFNPHRGSPNATLPPGTYGEVRNGAGAYVTSGLYYQGFPGQTSPQLDLPSGLPGSSAAPDAVARTFTTSATGGASPTYRVLAAPIQRGGTLVVAIPIGDVTSTQHRLLIIEGIVSGIVLLLVAGLALWLVRVGLRPLAGIGETAGAIAAGDLSRRVEPSGGRTEIGRLGESLNTMLAQIEAAFDERRASEERLRRFVADASHELRTPLTSIRGYSELFRRGADTRPEDLAKTMRRIEEEAGRMGVLVDDLLLLARLDQGRPLEREPVDVGRVVQDVVDGARAIDPDRRIDVEVSGRVQVRGDDGRLRQVVANLLDNVRVHTPPRTPVLVTVKAEGDDVVLSVTDHGPGLPPEIAGRVFERFYRGDAARSRETGGAGLGLSIVSAIVEAHGGRVTTTSADGSGARFEVRLPIGPNQNSNLKVEVAQTDA